MELAYKIMVATRNENKKIFLAFETSNSFQVFSEVKCFMISGREKNSASLKPESEKE